MKHFFISCIIIGSITLAACNDGNNKTAETQAPAAKSPDTTQHASTPNEQSFSQRAPQFSSIDAKATVSMKNLVDRYLQVKNGLASDNAQETADGAKEMYKALTGFDKSGLTAEQKKIFEENEADLKEHAEHIGKSAGTIKHQREHFVSMSEDMYALVKAFGGGRTLYHDHCPMANENKGAMWLSEVKEIKNPYMGASMATCGTIEESIKQ